MTEPVVEDQETNIIDVSKDRRTIIFNLGGVEYTAVKPRKSEEWFVEIQMALSSGDTGKLLIEMERFFRKIVGAESHDQIKARRLDEDDDLTWGDMSESMHDIFEVWTTEADQPVRPTGRPSASSRGKRPTTRR